MLQNFFTGKIYQGKLKMICTPGLNCYSCPAAVTSCPVGATQLFLAGTKHSISLFVTGFLLTVGAIFGRFICGYVCPMGLFQDLLYQFKTPKLRLRLRFARYIKYVVLILFVCILPFMVRNELSGLGLSWFCAYICPAGTIFGAIPLLTVNESLRKFIGFKFILKTVLAMGMMSTAVVVYRFFCRVICPLGAFYSFFNSFAFMRMHCDKEACISCGRCQKACHIQINPTLQPNSPECIRCGNCVDACKSNALHN